MEQRALSTSARRALICGAELQQAAVGRRVGAIAVSRILNKAGVQAQVLPERVPDSLPCATATSFCLAVPRESPAAKLFLKDFYYNIAWFKEFQDLEVFFSDPKTGEPTALPHKPTVARGLITVSSYPHHDGGPIRMVILSRTDSAGTIAAAEFFSSP
jgi:hypothetical protein